MKIKYVSPTMFKPDNNLVVGSRFTENDTIYKKCEFQSQEKIIDYLFNNNVSHFLKKCAMPIEKLYCHDDFIGYTMVNLPYYKPLTNTLRSNHLSNDYRVLLWYNIIHELKKMNYEGIVHTDISLSNVIRKNSDFAIVDMESVIVSHLYEQDYELAKTKAVINTNLAALSYIFKTNIYTMSKLLNNDFCFSKELIEYLELLNQKDKVINDLYIDYFFNEFDNDKVKFIQKKLNQIKI